MTNESNSGPKGGQEDDPLSATAMFFRTLDQQGAAKPAEPPAKFDFGDPFPGAGQTPSSEVHQSANEKDDFTAIFGGANRLAPAATPDTPRAEHSGPVQPTRSEPPSAAHQAPGEFTRIFVKGTSTPPRPSAKVNEVVPEAPTSIPPRSKGFSSPGVSDAASSQTSFSQFFKPPAGISPASREEAQPASPPAFRLDTPRPGSPEDPFRPDPPFGKQPHERKPSGEDPQSITNLIQSLSSPVSSSASSLSSDPLPYRSESQPPFQPVSRPPASSELDSGGVTQFIRRLAEMPPTPVDEPPAALPTREQDSGPGEYTRIISAPTRPIASTPAPPTPAAPPASGPAFVRPVLPAVPVVPPIPTASAVAPHPSPMPAMQPPVIPTPHLPAMPPPPALASPKGRLEAFVPILLVVNTFLLVVILVVMIFLIKAR